MPASNHTIARDASVCAKVGHNPGHPATLTLHVVLDFSDQLDKEMVESVTRLKFYVDQFNAEKARYEALRVDDADEREIGQSSARMHFYAGQFRFERDNYSKLQAKWRRTRDIAGYLNGLTERKLVVA